MTPGAGELTGIEAGVTPGQPEWAIADAEYLELRRRIHDVVLKLVPAGSIVVVVSKGDDQLVSLQEREGWHFPRTSAGQYGGYHPADAVAAISHLEELRALGADYFLLPSAYFWWLDHYPELAAHLQSRYRLVTDRPDSCLIYHLNEPPLGTPTASRQTITLEPAGSPDAAASPVQLVAPMRELLASVLEPEAGVLVLSDGSDDWLSLGRRAWHFPQDASGRHVPIHRSTGLSMLAQLDALRDRGAWYLVIPSTSFSRVERAEELVRYLRRCRLIALRERVCAVFALADPGSRRGGGMGQGVMPDRWESTVSGPSVLGTVLSDPTGPEEAADDG